MSSKSYLRSAISSFIKHEIDDVEILTFDTVEEASALPEETLAEINLILIHCRNDLRDQHDLSADVSAMRRLLTDVPIVLMGDSTECHGTQKALQVGAKGFIPESTPAEIVKHALPLVAVGGIFLPATDEEVDINSIASAPTVMQTRAPQRNLDHSGNSRTVDISTNEFTEREIDVLMLLGNGLQNKLIAYELGLKESTVKVHVRHIMKKLKATSRTQAALFAQRQFSDRAFEAGRSEIPPGDDL